MKVRIGIGIGRQHPDEGFEEACSSIVDLGFDSLWLSEVLTSAGVDPMVGLAFAAARHPTLKLGTTMLFPGRNVVRLAKSLASLDRLSAGRLLVTFVPGLALPPERDAIGVEVERRGAVIAEGLPLLRSLLVGQPVSYTGSLGSFYDVVVSPTPVQEPLEFWLGGFARSSLVRCGELGDGWLPSLCAPERASAGRKVIEEAAEQAGRVISEEHFGVSVPYVLGTDEESRTAASARRGPRAADVAAPVGAVELRSMLEAYLEIGFSKFVLRPLVAPRSWSEELGSLFAAVGDLQS